ELDPRVAWPFHPVHPEGRPQQPVTRGAVVFLWHAQHEEGRVHKENKHTARTEEPGGLRHPAIRVGPQARAVLGDREIEAGIRIALPGTCRAAHALQSAARSTAPTAHSAVIAS